MPAIGGSDDPRQIKGAVTLSRRVPHPLAQRGVGDDSAARCRKKHQVRIESREDFMRAQHAALLDCLIQTLPGVPSFAPATGREHW